MPFIPTCSENSFGRERNQTLFSLKIFFSFFTKVKNRGAKKLANRQITEGNFLSDLVMKEVVSVKLCVSKL